MSRKTFILGVILILAVGGAASLVWAGGRSENGDSEKDPGTTQMETMSPDAEQGKYVEYSAEAFDAAADLRRVYFFHASWCSYCRNAEKDITKNLDLLPDDVVVFKTDYDTENAIKQRYGITSQHTFVIVDASGEALKKWGGGGA